MFRFSLYRKYLRTYAVAIPVLIFAAWISLETGQVLLAAMLGMLAWYLHAAVPRPAAAQLKGMEGTGIVGHLESIVVACYLLWVLSARVTGSAPDPASMPPDWRLIIIAVLLTVFSIVRRWRRTELLSDADLSAFYSAGK